MSLFKQMTGFLNFRKNQKTWLLFASALFIIAGWMSHVFWESAVAFDALMITAAVIAGYDIVKRAWRGLLNKHTNIELLVSIAAVGGIAIGVYWESAAVTFLFLLGGWLEAKTINKTRNTLKELMDLAPDTAEVVRGEQTETVPAHTVQQGALVLVKPGSKIPVDGEVESGVSTVDESSITGESIPVEKYEGSQVFAGTINQNGSVYVRCTQAGRDTTLAKIIRRVEEAQESKAPTQRFIERFARWYTPSIVGMSVVSFLITQNIELALTLLVIGCPGALVISTPISIISGIGRAAKKGILIKGGEYLENAGKISAIALDKTGTLTEGKPRVTDVFVPEPQAVAEEQESREFAGQKWIHTTLSENEEAASHESVKEVLYWAGIAESVSEHPLAKAIVDAAGQVTEIPKADHFLSHTGLGVEATFDERTIWVGSPSFIKEKVGNISPQLEDKIEEMAGLGRTSVLVALDDEILGGVGIADQIRPEAIAMIQKLRKNGIKEVVMLTGDAKATAETIAKEAGITSVHAGMLPEHKMEVIKELQEKGHTVAMVGDGVNDAPALATADVGIAMGAGGTDVAIETADIALMTDDLLKIPESLRLSRKTLSNVRQNVVVALATVGLLLAGVFSGHVHMAGGMLVHELSVMAVILNGMRLRWA